MLCQLGHAPIYAGMCVKCSRIVVPVVGTCAYTSRLQLLQADSAGADEH